MIPIYSDGLYIGTYCNILNLKKNMQHPEKIHLRVCDVYKSI